MSNGWIIIDNPVVYKGCPGHGTCNLIYIATVKKDFMNFAPKAASIGALCVEGATVAISRWHQQLRGKFCVGNHRNGVGTKI